MIKSLCLLDTVRLNGKYKHFGAVSQNKKGKLLIEKMIFQHFPTRYAS